MLEHKGTENLYDKEHAGADFQQPPLRGDTGLLCDRHRTAGADEEDTSSTAPSTY